MRHTLALVLRFTVAVAVLAAVAALLPSSSAKMSGPYLSALSDLTATTVLAAPPGCNHQSCGQAPSGLKFRCLDAAVNTHCKALKGGTDCSISAC